MIAVGIDVSKSKSTVAILNSDGEILAKPYDIHHVESDIDNLITYLHSLHDDIKIVMEATGHYHLPVLKKLHNADLFICVMNPYLMKKYGDNEIRRGKTDKKDAMRMAFYALEKSYALTRYSTLDQKYLDLKFLSRQYNQRVSTKIKNRVYLGNLLDETMPGIENILMSKNINPENNMLYKFIEKYQNFDTIKSMGQKRFLNSYAKLAEKLGCRSYQRKALQIYELASDSITTRGSDHYTVLSIEQCLTLLKQSEIAAKAIMVQMQSTYVELDSSVKNNIEALETIVNYAMDKDIPYFAVNVPNDMCEECGYTDDIGEECPMCKSKKIRRLRRVTGYLR